MADPNLQTVLQQYFSEPISSTFLGSDVVPGTVPQFVISDQVEEFIAELDSAGAFQGMDLPNTVIDLMLPPGTILSQGDANSLSGLGGFHGSVHAGSDTVYYAVGVYAQVLGPQVTNGIPVFDQDWKNVVAAFYHELCEARTDPDVSDANLQQNISLAGWLSPNGEEIGDSPIDIAQQIGQPINAVFQEVPLTDGSGSVPIQLMWSNEAHGPANPTPQGAITPALTDELLLLELLALFM
jgi:hypothetical protein